jgi:hypothetical protein
MLSWEQWEDIADTWDHCLLPEVAQWFEEIEIECDISLMEFAKFRHDETGLEYYYDEAPVLRFTSVTEMVYFKLRWLDN